MSSLLDGKDIVTVFEIKSAVEGIRAPKAFVAGARWALRKMIESDAFPEGEVQFEHDDDCECECACFANLDTSEGDAEEVLRKALLQIESEARRMGLL